MKLLYILIFCCISVSLSAQNSGVSGTVVNAETKQGLDGISVRLQKANVSVLTDKSGGFRVMAGPGRDSLIISSSQISTRIIAVVISLNSVTELGNIEVKGATPFSQNVMLLDEEELNVEDDHAQTISGLLVSSDDVYFGNVGYTFSPMRFRIRGYDQEHTQTYINGVNFNSSERGRFYYGTVGGLNDAVKNKDVVNGLETGTYTFGDIGGATNINMKAGSYARGGRITASYTNRSYNYRLMGTYSTGLMENGWAFTVSGSRRYADEGYIDGTYYDAWSCLLGVEKVFNDKHRLSFTTFVAPSKRGSGSATYQEVYDVTGNNHYNPNWGYQNGKKRNARETESFAPVAILAHDWNISDRTRLSTGLAARYNKYKKTALSWYNAPDPRPDYYRNLPSYQTDSAMIALSEYKWRNDVNKRQINWNELYKINYNNDRTLYMVEGRNDDYLELSFNSSLTSRVSEKFSLSGGLEGRRTIGKHYKTVEDLLGGKSWIDVDKYAERDFADDPDLLQNDLNNPDREVTEDDVFGYDYEMHVTSANVWFQNNWTFSHLDFYYGVKLTYSDFYRKGKMRNGRAPNNSYGKGTVHRFGDVAAKLGGRYKITGRHILAFNGGFETEAPLANNAYLSPRIKDQEIPDLENGVVYSGDFGYILNLPRFRGRVSAYYTFMDKQVEIDHYYHDGYGTFMNFVMTGIQKEYRGIEFGAEAKVTDQISVTAIGNIGDYRYVSRPEATGSYENGSEPDFTQTIYLKNFHIAGTPGIAASLGVDYFHPSMWFVNVNGNYYDHTYLDVSPTRRTSLAVSFPTDGMTQEQIDGKLREISRQEELGSKFTMDVSVGKLIYFENNNSLNINVTVQNVFNDEDMRTGGYEQGRFDFTNYDVQKFPSRYYYAQGLNFFVNVGYRF